MGLPPLSLTVRSFISMHAGANCWLARAGPLLRAFGMSLNERKCVTLSLERKDGRTRLHWGLGVRNVEKSFLVQAVKDLGRCLNLLRVRDRLFTPVRLLLFVSLCAQVALYEEYPEWKEALRDLESVHFPP